MYLLKKIVLFFIFLLLFLFVLFFFQAPSSWATASILQILAFFISFFMFIVFTANLFLSFIAKSVGVGIGVLIFILILALEKLNLISLLLIIFMTILLIKIVPKNKDQIDPGLTKTRRKLKLLRQIK